MVDSGTVLLRTQEQLVIWSRLAPKNLISDYPRPCGALNRCIQLPAACYASKSDHLALFHAITTQALIRRRVPRKFVFNSIENADAIPSIVITKDLHGAKSTGQSKRRSQRRVPSHPCGGGYFHYVSTVEMLLSLLPPSFPRIVCGLSAFAGPTTTRYPLPSFAFVMNPNLLGSIEIGALVAVILLGMVTVQIYVYYINFPHDSKIIKTLIAIVWITETGHVAGICYGLYRMTVTRYGHLDLPIPLELCMAAILGNAIHPLVQAIFTARIYQLGTNAQNRFLTAICWAISGFILGATVLLSIKVFSATSIDQFEEEWDWLILGLFGATGGVDLLIAASMCYYTLKNRALLKPESGKIDTIISWTAQTGLFTSMAAITVAVCFATMKQDHIWLPLLILTTGLYSNSLLSLLNGRLQLGYQTADPFVISLSTFHQSNRSRSQVQFSYPPVIHLKPPSPLVVNLPPSSVRDSWPVRDDGPRLTGPLLLQTGSSTPTRAGSTRAESTRAGSTRVGSMRAAVSAGMLATTPTHYTLAREARFQVEPA